MSARMRTRIQRQPKPGASSWRPVPALRPSEQCRGPQTIPPVVHDVLHSPGQPLDSETRSFFKPRFGHDFSQVRVHTDRQAAASAEAVNASAYTVGQDVVFGPGQYAPRTSEGQALLHHELTHVVEQREKDPSRPHRAMIQLQTAKGTKLYELPAVELRGGPERFQVFLDDLPLATIVLPPKTDVSSPRLDFKSEVAREYPGGSILVRILLTHSSDIRLRWNTSADVAKTLRARRINLDVRTVSSDTPPSVAIEGREPEVGPLITIEGPERQAEPIVLAKPSVVRQRVSAPPSPSVPKARSTSAQKTKERQKKTDPRVTHFSEMIRDEVDSLVPSYKVMISALIAAKNRGGIPQLVNELRSRRHPQHGTYFVGMLRALRSRGSKKIQALMIKLMEREGVSITETAGEYPEIHEEYPLRYQIHDYLVRNIQDTKKILIGEPRDSIWWVLKGTLVETFYTFEEGFVDALQFGKGSEEAARAFAFEKDAVKRWCGVVKGLSEDLLRITGLGAAVEKTAARTFEKAAARQMAGKADDAIRRYAEAMDDAGKKAATQAERQAAEVAADTAEATRSKARSVLSEKPELEVVPTSHPPVGAVSTRRPKGFEPTAKGTKKRVKAGTLEELEPTAHRRAPKRKGKSVTKEQQLEGIEFKTASEKARDQFNGVRDKYAKQLGVGKGGQVHHAAELQLLDRYPGTFTAKELNQIKNMRGIPAEQGGLRQLHNAKIREIWDRHYQEIDQAISAKGLKPYTSEYNKVVRQHVQDGVKEIDYVLGQFFTEIRRTQKWSGK